jgi:ComF family protein
MWRPLTDALLSALLAPPCAACARVLDQPSRGAVCHRCWASIAAVATPFSLRTISAGCAIGPYEGTLRDIVHALKYDGRRSIGPHLARLMALHGRDVLAGADAVVPVPLHGRRLRERGFNQADDLARGLGVPVWRALGRVEHTRAQVDLPAAERYLNVRNAFALLDLGFTRIWRSQPSLVGRTIVLVDDVTTTGATLDACARVLREAGARQVRALTAAQVANALR